MWIYLWTIRIIYRRENTLSALSYRPHFWSTTNKFVLDGHKPSQERGIGIVFIFNGQKISPLDTSFISPPPPLFIFVMLILLASSYVNTREIGIVLVALVATTNFSMSWQCSYSSVEVTTTWVHCIMVRSLTAWDLHSWKLSCIFPVWLKETSIQWKKKKRKGEETSNLKLCTKTHNFFYRSTVIYAHKGPNINTNATINPGTTYKCGKLGFQNPILAIKGTKYGYHFKFMARSSSDSTWRMALCFSCCFNLLATDSGSNESCACCASVCWYRTSCSNALTSLTKSTLRSVSSASSGGRSGPWCCWGKSKLLWS